MSKSKANSDVEVPVVLIKHLLTDSEWRMVKMRLKIIHLVREGLSIREIAKKAKVGTDTVVRVSKMFKSNHKIKEYLEKNSKVLPGSKYIFGGSEE